MADETKTSGRATDGTFAPGNSFGGRPPGSRNKITLAIEELLEGDHDTLTRKAIEKALAGDTTALRLCLDRLAPPRKDTPVAFTLPPIKTAADAVGASSALLAAVAAGEVTPTEAGRVMALLTAHKALVETGDMKAASRRWKRRMRTIERRLQALELRRQAIDEKREDEVFGAALRLLSDAELHQFDSIALRHEAGEPLENMCESDRQFVEKLEAMCEAIAP